MTKAKMSRSFGHPKATFTNKKTFSSECPLMGLTFWFLFLLLQSHFEGANSRAPLGPGGLFPGTLWCGAGNSATHPDQLGIFPATDRCCRAHDQCPVKIHPFQTRFGLFNSRLHTVSHCTCDRAFRSCLQLEGSENSKLVGRFFFSQLKAPCFEASANDLMRECIQRNWWGTCRQWQDVPRATWRDSDEFRM